MADSKITPADGDEHETSYRSSATNGPDETLEEDSGGSCVIPV